MANNMKAILLVLTILPVFMIVIPSEGIAFAQIVSQDDNQGNDDCESLLGELSFMSLDAFLEDCNYQGNDDQGNDDDDQGSNNNDDDDDDQGSNNNDDDDD